jgi:hypothetical protein
VARLIATGAKKEASQWNPGQPMNPKNKNMQAIKIEIAKDNLFIT